MNSLCPLSFVIILALLWLEYRRYASLQERIRWFQESHVNPDGSLRAVYSHDELMELVQFSQHGILGVYMSRAVGGWRRLRAPTRRRSKWLGESDGLVFRVPCSIKNLRSALTVDDFERTLRLNHPNLLFPPVALITHPLALAPLLIGLLGLLCGAIQIRAIHSVQATASSLTTASLDNMSATMTSKLNQQLATRGDSYVSSINQDIAAVQKVLDEDLFGEWVNTTTVVLNSTLVVSLSDIAVV